MSKNFERELVMRIFTGWLVSCSPPTPPLAKAPAGACHHDIPAPCTATPPSFADQVEPLLEKRCFRCHAGDGPAADEHDFSKKDVVFRQRKDILDEVATCAMPPKAPLNDADSNVLLRWAACAKE